MAVAFAITEEAKQYIRDNCAMTIKELRDDIENKFGIKVTEQAVWEHTKRARMGVEEATRNADAHISRKIAERVDEKILPLLEMTENEIMKIYKALQGEETNIGIHQDLDKNGDPTGKLSSRDYATFEKLFQDSIKNYVQLRPAIQTVKIEGLGDRFSEDEFLKSLSDDEVAALEAIAKKREKFESPIT